MLKKTKKFFSLLLLPLLMGGCAATFTNLTPTRQTANSDNLYPVEVAFTTRQQSLRWESINPQIVVGTDVYPMRQTPLMTNRWEGLIPVAPGTSLIHYRYKFDFLDNSFGAPKPDSAISPQYTLRILNQ